MVTAMHGDDVVRSLVAAIAPSLGDAHSEEWAERLGQVTELVAFAPGDLLTQHHEVADNLSFLVSGTIVHSHLVTDATETTSGASSPFFPIGWSGLDFGRYRAAVTAEANGEILRLPFSAWTSLATEVPLLAAHLGDFMIEQVHALVTKARGGYTPQSLSHGADHPEVPEAEVSTVTVLAGSSVFRSLTDAALQWIADHSTVHEFGTDEVIIPEGAPVDGVWLLGAGRVRHTFRTLGPEGPGVETRHQAMSGSTLALSPSTRALPSPDLVEATRGTAAVHIPRTALERLREEQPGWYVTATEGLLRQLRSILLSSRLRFAHTPEDGGIDVLRRLIDDGMPLHPSSSALNALPDMFEGKLTRRPAFRLLHRAHRRGNHGEREVAELAIDLLHEFERGHCFTAGMRTAYDGVVRNNHLPAERLRAIARRLFRDALGHIPYVIEGLDHLPDDPNCIFIFNHMAYADESILPNGFLYNPDSHILSSLIVGPTYGDSVRVARTNAPTEFWRADYYEPLGHIGVVTPESGWVDESPEEKQARKERFFAECQELLERGQPLCIAPEGTITEEDSTTEKSPGPLKPGAFLLSGRLPSRPRIVPVAMANFDKPAHTAVFSCVIKPSFTMEERGIDVEDRAAMRQFLEDYRKEFRGHVEEAIHLAERIDEIDPRSTNIRTNGHTIDPSLYEYDHDVRFLEARAFDQPPGAAPTVFYGSSTIGRWDHLQSDVNLPDAVQIGFGGSTLQMAQHYFRRLVVEHEPGRLVLYCGENDIAAGATAGEVTDRFTSFAELVEIWLPDTECWFVSMKTGPTRSEHGDELAKANRLIAASIADLDAWTFLDWAPLLCDEHGEPDTRFFARDGFHVNRDGYATLAALLRDALAEGAQR